MQIRCQTLELNIGCQELYTYSGNDRDLSDKSGFNWCLAYCPIIRENIRETVCLAEGIPSKHIFRREWAGHLCCFLTLQPWADFHFFCQKMRAILMHYLSWKYDLFEKDIEKFFLKIGISEKFIYEMYTYAGNAFTAFDVSRWLHSNKLRATRI